MDSRILIFITTTLAVIAAAIIGVAVGTGELLVPTLAVCFILAVLFIAKPPITVFLTIALFASQLNSPGLPGQFGLYEIAAMSVYGAAIITVVFTRKIPLSFGISHLLLVLFCLLLIAIGAYRGFGLRFLGSNLWGGYAYVQILLAAGLVMVLPVVNMPASWWRWAILAMACLSVVPLIADLLTLAGFRLQEVRLFVNTTGVFSNEILEQQEGLGIDRITSAGTTAQAMLIALLSWAHTRKLFDPRTPWVPVTLVCLVLLSFLSGFRLMTATIILITFLVILLQRTLTLGRIVAGVIGCLVALALVYQFADSLPSNMQRAISWLPGIHISQTASLDASATVAWRLELWQQAMIEIRPYLWLGRGLAFSGEQLLRTMVNPESIDWALVVGAYHNGYLSLEILTGFPGLVIGLSMLIAVVWRHWKRNGRNWNNPYLHLAHQAFLASVMASTIIFFTIYGDISTVFPGYFFYWAIMEALCKADESERQVWHETESTSDVGDYAELE